MAKEYFLGLKSKNKDKKNVQDAHEAIRPTSVSRTPESVKGSLSKDQFSYISLYGKDL